MSIQDKEPHNRKDGNYEPSTFQIKRMHNGLRHGKIPPDPSDLVTTTALCATLPTDQASQDVVINSVKCNQDHCKNDISFWRNSTLELLQVIEVYKENITELDEIAAQKASESEEMVMKVKSLQAQLKEQAAQKISNFDDMV